MKRLMIAIAFGLVGTFGVSAAQAGPRVGVAIDPGGGAVVFRPGWDRVDPYDRLVGHGRGVVDPRFDVPANRAYFHTHAVRYRDGFYYRGLQHRHWDHRIWDAGCGRYHYWDPYLRSYFYYDTVRLSYYPVSPIVLQPWMLR
jgi:hypothetical protein